jgi:pentatricopeptide repeat protein
MSGEWLENKINDNVISCKERRVKQAEKCKKKMKNRAIIPDNG